MPLSKRKIKELILAGVLLLALNMFGVFTHFFEKDFHNEFHYPYDGDIEEAVQQLKNNQTPHIRPINSYRFKYSKDCIEKCRGVSSLRLVYLIKSAPGNFHQRVAIRSSWGYEKRFSDVEIRTVFLVGMTSPRVQKFIDEEAHKFKDIVQADFVDTYYNNTYKVMMGFDWVVRNCPHSKFYMFVDDDYYVSTKNVLRFVRNPTNYPAYIQSKRIGKSLKQYDFELDDNVRFYSGYTFESAPHRHLTSKWYVSLDEYPYHKWPPYVTAGAIVLSREALHDMHYASFYTKHFRFDDIYIALLAFKSKIEPFHSDEFHFYKLTYPSNEFKHCVASHGYGDPDELMKVWTEQRSRGNA